MKIEDLELTIRSSNALRNAGVTSVEQLVQLNWRELRAVKDAGEKSITEICWACMALLSGQMAARRIDWDSKFSDEIAEKARKYDKIAALVTPNA